MKRYCYFLLFLFSCTSNTQLLKEFKKLPDYPSASGIECSNGRFYIMGDDATHLLVLDSLFTTVDSIGLFSSPEKRMPKPTKPDLESITLTSSNGQPKLLLLGSGSLTPYRNTACLFDPATKQYSIIHVDSFYQRLKSEGLTELNIEGSTAIPGNIVLANRGHRGSPRNYLVFTSNNFWEKQHTAPIDLVRIGGNDDTSAFHGISGIAYARNCDKLIMTVSTEETRSVHEDGAIGKSYLWIIDNISSKKNWRAINPNRIIALDKCDDAFKGQKIESVCVLKESTNFLQLALVADNDDGSSTLFRMEVSKK